MLDTLPPRARFRRTRDGLEDREILVLVVAWSWDEPGRVGEIIPLPFDVPGRVAVFGRGKSGPADQSQGLQLYRQRPGVLEPTTPLQAPSISREQLKISLQPSGAMLVLNVGQCRMLHNGARVEHAEVQHGDVIELEDQLVLLCVRRPERFRPMPDVPLNVFGQADINGIVGESAAIWELRDRIAFCAAQSAHVLILGPSGSGKELVARAMHTRSERRKRPLVSRNAATFPEGLIDAELFGNAKNYPNPGMPDRPGLMGEADGSTLFLDEFGELPIALQAHLLRVMDEGEYQRLGEVTLRRTDFRLVAATNRPASYLKHDILARLALQVALPDLNARREDIPLLVRHLLKGLANDNPTIRQRFSDNGANGELRTSPALITFLVRHRYNTHVRELKGLLWQAIAASREDFIEMPPGQMAEPDSGEAGVSVEREAESAVPEAPLASPTLTGQVGDPLEAGLEPHEQLLLALCRRYRFNISECSRDPTCPVERATADLYLRVLLFRALSMAGWHFQRATRLVVGLEDEALSRKVRDRLETTVENLRSRLALEDDQVLREKLARYYRSGYRHVEPVLEAIQAGRLHG